jgi:hypothetical protein
MYPGASFSDLCRDVTAYLFGLAWPLMQAQLVAMLGFVIWQILAHVTGKAAKP